MEFETVIGLEIHAQLQTESKLFCGDSIKFGAEPNTQVSPISLAHPGTLPKTNKKAIELAIKLGIACECNIQKVNYFARKNYFYPDLPKGYQISQHTAPICIGGMVEIDTPNGIKRVELNRIHIEEDAGKSIHDMDGSYSYIDLNRAGTPLVEIVTEPCMHSSEEAFQFVTELRRLVQWIGVCDGNMEEGSFRCDANVSIRPKGEKKLGTKVEVKNLNSIRNVKRAIDFEVARMIKLVSVGGKVIQQTRGFDANSDTTYAIRDKEDADDYRYFADPDLPPFRLTDDYLESVQSLMPTLPRKLEVDLQENYGLSLYDAKQLSDAKETADFFLTTAQHSKNYKAIANWMLGPIRQYLNENGLAFSNIALLPTTLADLIALVESGGVNFSIASSKILPLLMVGDNNPRQLAEQLNLIQTDNAEELEQWVNMALQSMPDKVAEYKKGKKGLIGLFVGEVKKLSKGKADPKAVTAAILEKIS